MVYRATSSCPICNYKEEVWLQNGTVCFSTVISCAKCTTLYEPLDNITHFMELRSNVTVSAKGILNQIRT